MKKINILPSVSKISQIQLWTEFNFLVVNLLVTELLVASIGIPIEVVAAAQLGWKLGKVNCIMFGFTLTFLGNLARIKKCLF